MATRVQVHRPLKVVAFNANGIGNQHFELSKQLQDHHIDVALLSEARLKPLERFFIPNYHVYQALLSWLKRRNYCCCQKR
jgi:hypothetical protein